MPLAASVVLSTVRRLRGLILAPEASSRSSTFFATPVTSSPFNGITLSRPFTGTRRVSMMAKWKNREPYRKTPGEWALCEFVALPRPQRAGCCGQEAGDD